MEHRTIAELERTGEATPVLPLTRTDRLERWATVLEGRGSARLASLLRTEHIGCRLRLMQRADNSPLSVAFEDPVLRLAGLRDDTYGEAQRFFGLSDYELHPLICSCHFGEGMSAREVARRLRVIAAPPGSVARWLGHVLFGRGA